MQKCQKWKHQPPKWLLKNGRRMRVSRNLFFSNLFSRFWHIFFILFFFIYFSRTEMGAIAYLNHHIFFYWDIRKISKKWKNDLDQIKLVNAISTPLASKKLTKRVFKCAKKASKEKTNGLRKGVKVCFFCFFIIAMYSEFPIIFFFEKNATIIGNPLYIISLINTYASILSRRLSVNMTHI